jgi:hypothetical protein
MSVAHGLSETGAETGKASELIRALRDDLDDELVGNDFPARRQSFIEGISFVQLGDDATGVRGVGRLQILKGTVLGFFDVGADFIIIACHRNLLLFPRLPDAPAAQTVAG